MLNLLLKTRKQIFILMMFVIFFYKKLKNITQKKVINYLLYGMDSE